MGKDLESIIENFRSSVDRFFGLQREQEITVQCFIRLQEKAMALIGGTAESPLAKNGIGPPKQTFPRLSLPETPGISVGSSRGLAAAEEISQEPVADPQPSRSIGGPNRAIENAAPAPSAKAVLAKNFETGKSEALVSPDTATASRTVRRLVPKAVIEAVDKRFQAPRLAKDRAILIFEKKPAIGALVEKALARNEGNPILHVLPGTETRQLGDRAFQVCLTSPISMYKMERWIQRESQGVGAVVNVTAMTSELEQERLFSPFVTTRPDVNSGPDDGQVQAGGGGCEDMNQALEWFRLLKILLEDQSQSTSGSLSWIVNLSFMDGNFGLKHNRAFRLGQAGSIGLTKAVAREFPWIRVKCIDVDPEAAPLYLISRLKEEFAYFDDALEIGLDGRNRWRIHIAEGSASTAAAPGLGLDGSSVVLFLGGAYGIVAEVAKKMALRYGAHLVLVGRSRHPGEEAAGTRHLKSEAELRHHFIEDLKKEAVPMTPAAVMNRVKALKKRRRMRETLGVLERSAASVEYHAVDVTNEKALGKLIDHLYAKWGNIDGVVHGAGIIEDKRIDQKTEASFERVFNTKATPAMVLKAKLKPEKGLKFLVFFSSVAARFGNAGQTDYCAGNEVLNKLADRLHAEWESVRTVSINWGPWEYGMVQGDLLDLLKSKGFSMIDVKAGTRRFFEELERPCSEEPEVVITGSIPLTG